MRLKNKLQCGHNRTQNFGGGHLFCSVCGSHFYDGDYWTKAEWAECIEEEYDEATWISMKEWLKRKRNAKK